MSDIHKESKINQPLQEVNEKEVCLVVAGSVDSGKCYQRGTKVMLYTGKTEVVENLKQDDLLMGDDSTPRKILEIHNGIGQLYKIVPEHGQEFVVNGEHILCLKYLTNSATEQFLTKIENNKLNYGDIIEISVKNFMKLSKQEQSMLKWYRVGIDFKQIDVPFDPYILGIWLDDNTLSCLEIINIDTEIINYFKKNLPNYESELNTELSELFSNKHIPDIYKYNSRDIRLKVLAGLIDSYGYYDRNKNLYSFIMSNNYETLIDDMIYLIKSLGFFMYKYNENIIGTDCSKIEFGGIGQDEIPCQVMRKKAEKYNDKNNMVTCITIELNEIGDYYGFSLDKNKRFLLEDFSVSHNSSFIGVIVSDQLDDGKGSARAKVAKHPHEIREGKTSDISSRTLTYGDKKLTLVDLCGHEKYLKTTLFGMTGFFPDYGIVIVSSNRGLLKMTREHMGILIYLSIPFIILITRIDITPRQIYENVLDTTTKLLKRHKRSPELINGLDEFDLMTDKDKLKEKETEGLDKMEKSIKKLKSNPFVVPIVTISNKTGYYIDVTKHMLSKLEPRKVWNSENLNGSIFYVDSKFVPPGIGLVVSGITKGKTINAGTEMLIGPYGSEFKRIKVWSIHNNSKEVVSTLVDRQRGCLAIKGLDKKDEVNRTNIRKGMLIISKELEQNVCYQFTSEIEILNHSTVISPKYTPVIHCGIIRQSAKIVLKPDQQLKMGDRASVDFRFVQYPEFMEVGEKFFFREGTTRGVGEIKSILAIKDDPDKNPAEAKKKKFHKQRRHKGNFKNNNQTGITNTGSTNTDTGNKKIERKVYKKNIVVI